MEKALLRTVWLVSAIAAALLFMGIGNVAASTPTASSSDFSYQPQVVWQQLDPLTVTPQAVPECHTSHTYYPTTPVIFCYSPDFLRSAYDLNPLYAQGFDGSGQTIVIVDAYGSATIASDLHAFDTLFGLPDPSFTILCPAGCPPTTTAGIHFPTSWAVETSLDVEWAHAIAPGANIVLVVAPSNSGNALNTVERLALPMFPGSIMSQSFGVPEILVTANNAQILQAHANYMMAVQDGVTVLASAGDFGATNGYATQNALFPSSDPLVTSVGGTQGLPEGNLATFAPCKIGFALPECTPTGYGAEAVWNEPYFPASAGGPAATGGAESLLFGTPDYQSGLGLSMRGTPDIAYNAAVDGGVLVFISNPAVVPSPGLFIVGGTSAGSPQWSAIFAIANQVRAANHLGPLGFVNPTIYGLSAAQKASDFHDITVGDNSLGEVLSGNSAAVGWDLASGWGTPDAANLVSDLG